LLRRAVPSVEEIVNPFAEHWVPVFDLHRITSLNQGKGSLSEGVCDMGIGPPVGIKSQQYLLGPQLFEHR
jgi:hypothetical protein